MRLDTDKRYRQTKTKHEIGSTSYINSARHHGGGELMVFTWYTMLYLESTLGVMARKETPSHQSQIYSTK